MRRLKLALALLGALCLTPSLASAASGVYDNYRKAALNDTVNLSTDTIKVILVNGYAFSASHTYYSDVSASEVAGTGYTAGGQTLSGLAWTVNAAAHTCVVSCANPSWPSSTITATGAIVYKSTGTASTSPLISYIDFGGTVTSTAGTFAITSFVSTTTGFLSD